MVWMCVAAGVVERPPDGVVGAARERGGRPRRQAGFPFPQAFSEAKTAAGGTALSARAAGLGILQTECAFSDLFGLH